MLIDWFTVLAQAANFLILVWLMKRYLYKPILTAIDVRDAQVAAALKDAQARQDQAGKERDDYQQKNKTLDDQRAALLATATTAAANQRQQLLDAARVEAEALRRKLTSAVTLEHAQIAEQLLNQAQTEIFLVARQALTDLASDELEARIGDMFVQRLSALNDTPASPLLLALRKPASQGVIKSAFELPPNLRTQIEQVINCATGSHANVEFTVTPQLICGIELGIDGYKIAWNLDDYLAALKTQIDHTLLAATPVDVARKPNSTASVAKAPPSTPAPAAADQSKVP